MKFKFSLTIIKIGTYVIDSQQASKIRKMLFFDREFVVMMFTDIHKILLAGRGTSVHCLDVNLNEQMIISKSVHKISKILFIME